MSLRPHPLAALLLAPLLLLGASACTPIQPVGDRPPSAEELRLRAMEAKLDDLRRRTSSVENKTDSATQDELRRLRGELEQLRFDQDNAARQSKAAAADLERRVAKLEAAQQQAQAHAQAVVSATLGGPTPPLANLPANTQAVAPSVSLPNAADIVGAPVNAAEEEAAYQRAFDYLKAGKYDNAIVSFRAVIDRWPRGNYADDSWYWLGESQYVRRQYAPAFSAFSTIIERFPNSAKMPEALFKAGLTQNELGHPDTARSLWTRLTREYPSANAAGLARQRLAQLK